MSRDIHKSNGGWWYVSCWLVNLNVQCNSTVFIEFSNVYCILKQVEMKVHLHDCTSE